FDLVKAALREVAVVAARGHSLDHAVAEEVDVAVLLEGRHGPAQAGGLRRGEAGADDGDPHRLLLEQGHPHGLAEHLFQLLRGILILLFSLPAAKIGMNRVTLDRAWA